MVEYTELMTKFSALKEKECAVMTQSESKKERKESLLRMKETNALSKEELAELEYFDKEENIDATWETKKQESDLIRERKHTEAKAQAKAKYESARLEMEKEIALADASYNRAIVYYDSQKEQQLTKLNNKYTATKRRIEAQKKRIEDERIISAKTASEMNIDAQKRDLLTKMKTIIDTLQISRNQAPLADREKLPPVPILPETIVSQYVPVQPVSPTVNELYDIEEKNSALREEFRMKRRERDRADREREREESSKKPTVYGFVHELEGRPYVKPCYNAPIINDSDDVPEPSCDFFTKEV